MGSCFGSAVPVGGGERGGAELTLRGCAAGMDVGGAVWIFVTGGGGGTKGTFSGGITVLELGVAGVGIVVETEATAPGGFGIGSLAV